MLQPGTSLVEAARFLGVDQSTLYTALRTGQIPTTRRNGCTVITQGALMDYQARMRHIL
ncbi:helix-turn-helix domain-containing protein [Anabaena sphaerica FACHB-251]|uniref:Helix-turn-helix domain-containing protein n=1 Tax=Anabaena sphaerica FACHB-251 TaxID=2692883 RepID=A0A926WFW7_9NOST|nr:helix-turn-helix domain-containing protein [Anabaena sphaerica]MBD2293748.1 helix-turn-helix domain-containing protein [Anabaena sphaerica FACHB-251]